MKQEGDKRQAFAVIGPTDASRVSKVNPLGLNVDTKISCYNNSTVLILASREGRLDEVKVLLEAGANVNAKEKYGITALILASHIGYLEIVKELLIVDGINVNEKTNYGSTALINASCNGHLKIVQ